MSAPSLPAGSPSAAPQGAASAHADLLAQLQRPAALAGWCGAVQLVQTHISSLLMAGERVYKLKRPVQLGFLDFSTLGARQAACEAELRLNRRTAPALYLAVLPVLVAGTPGAVDWAVVMRRFKPEQGFDRLASAGRLTPAMVDALAAALALFHAGLPAAPACYGQPEHTRAWARTNLNELAALVAGEPALVQRLARLARWTEARGAALAPLMAARQRQGLVRELHGDLHLGNVVWHQDAPLLFDAIEFSDQLRHTDTVGDLAFAAMDLMAHGLPGLAWRFINAQWDASGDHDALPLLPWWAVYRALVRAKVARLGAGDAGAGTDAGVGARGWPAEAERYLRAAEAWAGLAAPAPRRPAVAAGHRQQGLAAAPAARHTASHTLVPGASPGAPQLVLMMGLSGSGKSVVAGVVAQLLPALRLRSDVLRKRLFGLAASARAPAALGLYSAQASRRTYTRLQALAAQALDAGLNVVLDAASLRQDERLALVGLARQRGLRYTLLLCSAPEPVLLARLAHRAQADQDASDATAAVLAQQLRRVQWPGPIEMAYTRVVNTDAPRAQVAKRVRALLAPTWADTSSQRFDHPSEPGAVPDAGA